MRGSRLILAACSTALVGISVSAQGQMTSQQSAGLPNSVAVARIGQTVNVDGPRVKPLAVIEDSRCPKGVECIWAGQVRIRVLVISGRSSMTKDLTLGTAIPVADGELNLVSVLPPRVARRTLKPRDYRFGFSFSGGL